MPAAPQPPAIHSALQVRQLQALLPHMSSLSGLKPAELVRMAAAVEDVSARLLALRGRFPRADVAAMIAAHPPLLRMDGAEVEAAVAAVQRAFPQASQVRSGEETQGPALQASCCCCRQRFVAYERRERYVTAAAGGPDMCVRVS